MDNGEIVLLEPLNTKFLGITNQMEFLTDYICHNVRILYPDQIFEVYNTDKHGDPVVIPFKVKLTNNSKYKIIKAFNTDLTVEFDYEYILSKRHLKEEIRDPFHYYNSSKGETCLCYYLKNNLYTGDKLNIFDCKNAIALLWKN